jgi:hypothetical protein
VAVTIFSEAALIDLSEKRRNIFLAAIEVPTSTATKEPSSSMR